MSAFSKALAVYIDTKANPACGISDEYLAAESVCNAIETKAQAQIAYDSLDDADRILGSHVVGNAHESAYHPAESSGAAYVLLDDGTAVYASWDDAGFWTVEFGAAEEASKQIAVLNLEWEEEGEYCEVEG